VARYNKMYARIVSQLEDVPEFEIPPYNARVRPVQDSLQVRERRGWRGGEKGPACDDMQVGGREW
jgi:hypothetical protein